MRIGPSVTEMALGTLWVGSLRLDGQGAWGVSAALEGVPGGQSPASGTRVLVQIWLFCSLKDTVSALRGLNHDKVFVWARRGRDLGR